MTLLLPGSATTASRGAPARGAGQGGGPGCVRPGWELGPGWEVRTYLPRARGTCASGLLEGEGGRSYGQCARSAAPGPVSWPPQERPRPYARPVPRVLALLGGLLLLSGCSGAAEPAAAPPSTTAAGAGGGTCSAPGPTTLEWPAGVPADLPRPPGAVFTSTTAGAGDLTIVRFSTDQALRDGVLHLVRELRPAGYTLGRGDAEAAEADAPFTKGALRGIYRLVARSACATDWLLAVTKGEDGAAGPLLPPPAGTASPSPLPFG